MRSWILGIVFTIVVLAIGVVLGAVGLFVFGMVKLGEAFSSETDATIRTKTDNGQVQFDLSYGKDITNLVVFIVRDADGKELWKLEGHGQPKPARLVYGVVPEGGKQTLPSEGKPPDIRGKHIKVEASCRFLIALGVGQQSSYAEFDIPH